MIMKTLIVLVSFIFISTYTYSQLKVTDSVFVEINKLHPAKINFSLYNDKINVINIDVKNKYQDLIGFIAAYSDSKFFLKKRESVPKEKVISYENFNEMLNKDFLKIYFYYKVYFIISEDRDNYLVLDVRPILPPELNKQ